MATREKYARVALTNKNGIKFIAGLEMKPNDRWRYLRLDLRTRAEYVVKLSEREGGQQIGFPDPYDYDAHAEAFSELIVSKWKDRAYFLEVGSDDEWVQIFQPYDLPKRDTA